ncbi:arylsulfatase [Flagellimonas sp. 389]|uniref:arylsulfatase n=1 Tax=Flagellimonas sp. 389 TaxID=2835862 RepID=UPI001BD40F9D|nr:arylsulfatase [Flagellimonas sp. 389]MBS9462896.1 arylsulfatase [Flagellimonas sp. 389]
MLKNQEVIKFKETLLLILFGFVITLGCNQKKQPPEPLQEDKRPNILVILADDLGYSDLGCYGGEINTPNLDGLAANGTRITQMYNSARCCPSRASLLTGLYPHQAGMGEMAAKDRGLPGYRGILTPNSVTIAEVLKTAGYRTFGAGKWHVNYPGPTERGFEEFYGFLEDYGVDSFEPKWMQRYPKGREERKYKEGEFFATDAITDYTLDFLELGKETPDQPWFMYVSYQAAHFPVQSWPKDSEKYIDTYSVGWDTIRARRFERMKELGVITKNITLSERSQMVRPKSAIGKGIPGDGIHNPAWELLDKDRQADLAKRMAVYAGMVDNMDQNIGRIIQYLKENGELEDTLILFLSDNGACGEWNTFGFEYPDHNARVHGNSLLNPNLLHKGKSLEKLGGPDGPLFSYGSGWANASNTPFSLYKMFTHEAGISTPFIAHWPEKIEQGTIFNNRYAHFNDIMATCVDIAQAEYPITHNGNDITPMEGVSLFQTLNDISQPKRVLTFEHWGYPAIRIGDWKLVSRKNVFTANGFKEDAKFELYNITADRSETYNLADQYPDKVEEMKTLMLSEFKRTQVLPKATSD